MAEQELDLSQISPEAFAAMVAGADDADIEAAFHAVGTDLVLDRVFQGMQERFDPAKAAGVNAVLQWVIEDGDEEHRYVLTIADGTADVARGESDDPRATLTTDMVSFARLVTGQAQGPALFMSRKLKVTGDIMFSARITSFFDMPKA